MCEWDSAHLGDVFQYIRDPTPHDDNDAHFAWRKRWVEAYKEAQWWIKIGSRYYREIDKLRRWYNRMMLRVADLQHELSRYDGMCAKCRRGQDYSQAEEIIKGLLDIKKIATSDEDYAVIAKAEAFIKG